MKSIRLLHLIACIIFNSNLAFANTEINFEDTKDGENISTKYKNFGITFQSISNPFPILGQFPSPEILPTLLGDVYSASFSSSPDLGMVAVSSGTAIAGENGVLLSFDFDITSLALQGVDAGFFYGIPGIRNEDESVTLTAYNVEGKKLGTTYSTINLSGPYDITPASISFPNMRYVAFNYTGDSYGFYAVDNISFTAAIPEPTSAFLFMSGLSLLVLRSRQFRF